MDDVVDDLCAAARRHESALHALRAPGHRAPTPEELRRLEHKLECCEQWLRLLHADEALERSRSGSTRPSIRFASRLPPPSEQSVERPSKGVRRAS